MSLRTKTLTATGVTLAGLVVVLYYASSILHMSGFKKLETEDAKQNVGRVVNAISGDLDQIGAITADYARWDDTYDYISTGNHRYVDVNLVAPTFRGLRLNLMLFIHSSGRVVYAGSFDPKHGRIVPVPSSVLKYVAPGSLLLRHPTVTAGRSGLLLLPEGPMIVSAQPILTSQGDGPVRGTVIFGRYLDSHEVARLAHLTDLRLAISDLTAKGAVPGGVSKSLANPGAITVQPLDNDTIAGYAVLKDAFGKPAVLLRTDMPRRIHRQGRASLGYFVLWFLAAGFAFCGVTLLLIERLVLSRLARLNSAVVGVGTTGDLSARVLLPGNDELSSLSATIDGMLGTLEQSQMELRAARDDLEERVRERTTELAEANDVLLKEIAERARVEAELRIQTSAINAAIDQILITNANGDIQFVNPAFENETGYSAAEVLGKNPRILKSGAHEREFYKEMWDTLLAGRTWRGEVVNARKDGSLATDEMTITPVKDDAGVVERFVAIKRDISEKKTYESRLDHMAHHDHLTGLPNRLLFADRLTQSLNLARRYGQSVAVMFLDLDSFKTINDTLGHSFGDLVLKAVADRLTSLLREVDTVARMGGDEFTIILERVTRIEQTVEIARKVLAALAEPFTLRDREVFVTTSIGISVYPADGGDVETLVRNADTAMYRAKEQGRGNYQFYTDALNASALQRMELENGLRKALERREFVLYYQPHVDLRTGMPLGSEALLRWQRPGIGIISPAQFIPLAEETGLIVPMTEWTLNTACAQNKAWQDAGYPPMDIAVNISARLFRQHDLVETVERALNASGLAPNYLTLELTESVLMEEPDAAGAILRTLKAMGIRVSVDDFGTGYSSLSYLKRFPVDTVKIDQSFVREIATNSDDAVIAQAIVAMAHSLKLNVIAEGVETLQQLQFLRSIKCDEMQGYFVSRPVPAKEFASFLEQLARDETDMRAA
ncbi:MAG: EAL domain-containing protein [Armatimonadota bacterium]|nr:EAL domain-containing protein [Armatimonadota bacterium]